MNHFSFSIVLMKKTDQKTQYNSSLQNLIPLKERIRYDKEVYGGIWSYIEKHLWKHMDKEWVKKVVFILDDPMGEYGDNVEMIKKVLQNFLPTVKKALNIDDKHQLKDRIQTPLRGEWLLDRLIQQQFNLYRQKRNSWWLLTKVLQEWPQKNYIDTTKPSKKELVSDKIPQTQKTIIANILTFMILEEELKK